MALSGPFGSSRKGKKKQAGDAGSKQRGTRGQPYVWKGVLLEPGMELLL